MAWDVKYYCEWTDILGLDWRVDIEKDGSFTAAAMQATGTPLSIEFLSPTDDLFDGLIKGSRADLTIYSETNFQWLELYAVEDQEFRMSVYYNDGSDHLVWRGFVITGNYQEPYNATAYPVIISAACGLGLLKSIKYDDSGTPYNGRKLESQIIIDILDKIGLSGFTEYVNIYEESMLTTVNDSPFDQVQIDTDRFVDMYCYEVLEEILKKYNAVIRSMAGQMTIYRPVELAGATVYGRIFTAATTKTSTSFSPAQYINRTTHTSDICDIEGGTLMIQRPAKKVTIYQDYGNKDSWLDNWKFEGSKFSGGGASIWAAENWTAESCVVGDIWPIGVDAPAEKDGIVLANENNYPDYSKYIHQTFGELAIVGAEVMCFEFEYQWFNRSGGSRASQVFYFHIQDVAANYSLSETDDYAAEWVTPVSATMSISETVADGPSGWKTWRRMIAGGIDIVGPYIIKFYLPDDTYFIGIGIRNVRFYSTADVLTTYRKISYSWPFKWAAKWKKLYNFVDRIEIVERQIEKTNAINGVDLEFDMLLGDVLKTGTGGTSMDNILAQFAGSLGVSVGFATFAATFVTDHAADYVAGGVVVTSIGNTIYFESSAAGTDFTGSTTITNKTGDLSGTASTTQANVTALPQIDTVTMTGTSGNGDITCSGVTRDITFDTDIETTCAAFKTDWEADYLAAGVVVTVSPTTVIFTASVAGTPFSGATTYEQESVDLAGSVVNTQANRVAVKRKDQIILSGTFGTADILCDAVTAEAGCVITYSTDWNTRGGSESKELLSIIADEIAEQFGRPKHFIELPVMEDDSVNNTPHVNILGNFQDELNMISPPGSIERVLVFNKGLFNTKDREWQLSLIEILDNTIPDGDPSALTATADGSDTIDLEWVNGSTNEDGISIERSLDELTWEEIDIVAAAETTYSDTTCEPSTTYYYRVRAFKNLGYSDYSNTDSDTTESEESYPACLDDANHWWYDKTDLTTITKDVSDFVSAWNSKGGQLGRNLLQGTGSYQPLWTSAGGVIFDGIDNFMAASFGWGQPEMIYMIIKPISWTSGDWLFASYIHNYNGSVRQYTGTPKISAIAGVSYSSDNSDLTIDTYHILRVLFNGANSKLQVDNNEAITGSWGAAAMNGITLAREGYTVSGWANIEVHTIVCANITDAANEAEIFAWLQTRIPS